MTDQRFAADPTPACPPDRNPGDESEACVAALASTVLLGGHSCIAIDHHGTRYILRATRTGKLILTK